MLGKEKAQIVTCSDYGVLLTKIKLIFRRSMTIHSTQRGTTSIETRDGGGVESHFSQVPNLFSKTFSNCNIYRFSSFLAVVVVIFTYQQAHQVSFIKAIIKENFPIQLSSTKNTDNGNFASGYTINVGFVAPMVQNGYGIFYSMLNDCVWIIITAYRGSEETSVNKFFEAFSQSLNKIKEILEKAPEAKL